MSERGCPLRYLRKAADRGVALAQYRMGNAYGVGRGVSQSYTSAAAWHFKRSQHTAVTRYRYFSCLGTVFLHRLFFGPIFWDIWTKPYCFWTRPHRGNDTWGSHPGNNMRTYENRLIASSHRRIFFCDPRNLVGRRLRGIYQHNVGVVSRFSAVDVPATRESARD
jgi:hypothetical protein